MAHRADKIRLLREQAERCYRHARTIGDLPATAALISLGKKTDAQIAILEIELMAFTSRPLTRRVQ
jgi:hypothetical protein